MTICYRAATDLYRAASDLYRAATAREREQKIHHRATETQRKQASVISATSALSGLDFDFLSSQRLSASAVNLVFSVSLCLRGELSHLSRRQSRPRSNRAPNDSENLLPLRT